MSDDDSAMSFAKLIERTKVDPSAPLQADALEQVSLLKQHDPAAFEALRAQLKGAGCRVTALDKALTKNGRGKSVGRGRKQAEILIELAQSAELFHTPDGAVYADLQIDGHRETWAIRAKGFRRWLSHRYYEQTGGAANSEAFQSALNVLEAKAHFGSPLRKVHLKVAGLDDQIYLDLADENWRAVEIGVTGWRVIENPPVRFRRSPGMQSLPIPVAGGSIETLNAYLNLKSKADFVLVVGWLLAALRNEGPYPVMAVSGEQGSAKSTFSAMLRALVDPNTAPLRALPREDRDLFIAANNGHVLAFDNVSALSPWISDTLCRIATGGGFAVRQLYTDQDEVLFDAKRPIILNGIEDTVTRPDLADRALLMTLEPISEQGRRPEAEIWAAFNLARPQILGVLLDGVVEGLRQLPSVRLEKLPRMADFARWATACESAFWPAGTFESAYSRNRNEAVEDVIDADPVAATVRNIMATQAEWRGTASELLLALGSSVGPIIVSSKAWPDSPRLLSSRLRRTATFLRNIGIEIEFRKEGHARSRVIHIRNSRTFASAEWAGTVASASPAASSLVANTELLTSLAGQPRTMGGGADGANETSELIACQKSHKDNIAAGADDADDESASAAAQEEHQQTCIQCSERPDGKERVFHVNGTDIYLHPECKRFYTDTASAGMGKTIQNPQI